MGTLFGRKHGQSLFCTEGGKYNTQQHKKLKPVSSAFIDANTSHEPFCVFWYSFHSIYTAQMK